MTCIYADKLKRGNKNGIHDAATLANWVISEINQDDVKMRSIIVKAILIS